jgi:hypothetical protein
MKYVIRYQGLAGEAVHGSNVLVGAYLRWFDVESHNGQGEAWWTNYAWEAFRFDTFDAAAAAWRAVPASRPTRPDGQPTGHCLRSR